MKSTDNYMLAVTFVEDWMGYEIVSANIGKIIDGKFVLVKSLEISNKLLNNNRFTKEDVNKLQIYLNEMWNNKGLLLLEVRSENTINSIISKILVNAHKHFHNGISSIVCGIASKEEFDAYKQSILDKEKQFEDVKKEMKEKRTIDVYNNYSGYTGTC